MIKVLRERIFGFWVVKLGNAMSLDVQNAYEAGSAEWQIKQIRDTQLRINEYLILKPKKVSNFIVSAFISYIEKTIWHDNIFQAAENILVVFAASRWQKQLSHSSNK